MAEELFTLDFTLNPGQALVTRPELAFRNIVYLTREGVGMLQESIPVTGRGFSFKTTGFFAYKILFFLAGNSEGENIHVIYK